MFLTGNPPVISSKTRKGHYENVWHIPVTCISNFLFSGIQDITVTDYLFILVWVFAFWTSSTILSILPHLSRHPCVCMCVSTCRTRVHLCQNVCGYTQQTSQESCHWFFHGTQYLLVCMLFHYNDDINVASQTVVLIMEAVRWNW